MSLWMVIEGKMKILYAVTDSTITDCLLKKKRYVIQSTTSKDD